MYRQCRNEGIEGEAVVGKLLAVKADVRNAGFFQPQGNKVCGEVVQAGENKNVRAHSPF
jgi:hypothetical protein